MVWQNRQRLRLREHSFNLLPTAESVLNSLAAKSRIRKRIRAEEKRVWKIWEGLLVKG